MTAPIHVMLESGYAIAKFNLCRQATLGEKFKRTIDGGVADGRFLLFNQAMQFFGCKVIASCQKDLQNCVPLRTPLESKLGQVIIQDSLCGREVVECAGLLIYSLLWCVFQSPSYLKRII